MFFVSYSFSHVCFLSQCVYFFCNSLVLLDGCSTIVSHVSKGLKWKEGFIDQWEGFQKHTHSCKASKVSLFTMHV